MKILEARPIPDFPGFWITRRGEVFSFWQCRRLGGNRGAETCLTDIPHQVFIGFNRGKRRVCMHRDGVKSARSVDALVRLVFGE